MKFRGVAATFHCFQLIRPIWLLWLVGVALPLYATPTLTTNLADLVAIAGTSATLQVGASDSESLGYQWYGNGVALAGATNASLLLTNIQAANAGTYAAVISDSSGSISSRANTVTVENYPAPTTIVAWGSDAYGQCNVPASETNVVALAAGGYQTLFIRKDGTLGAFGDVNASPATLSLLPRAGFVCSTGFYGLMLATNGTPVSFGDTDLSGASDVPASVTNAVAVAGHNPCLAILDDGTVVGWLPVPYSVPPDPGNIMTNLPGLSSILAVAMSSDHCLILRSNHTVLAFGDNTYSESTVPPGLSGVTAISTGLNHSVALKADGTVVAWGDNSLGQTNVPTGLSGVVSISAGNDHTLALTSNGTVFAWGDNSAGQCNVPANLSNVVFISAGGLHSTALTKTPGVAVTPTNQLVKDGMSVTFTTQATGYLPLSYQWQFDGTNVAGATDASYTINNIVSADQGNYTVLVSNPYGTGSATATLAVSPSLILNGGFETGDFTDWTLAGQSNSGPNVINGVVNSSFYGSASHYVHSGAYGAALGQGGYQATLSQLLYTVPGEHYFLSFWLENPTGAGTQIFKADWSPSSGPANTIYALTNPGIFAWTNCTVVVTATSTNMVLQFASENDDDYFGLDDVSAIAIPSSMLPAITGISLAGTNLTINGTNGISGATFKVLTSTNIALPPSRWAAVATNVLNFSGNFSLTITNGINTNLPESFYVLKMQ